MTSTPVSVTCTGPVNIAVIKYWGKRDEKLILPTNSSLSVTLDQKQLCATTTVAASNHFKQDRMWLNGMEQSLESPRLRNVLKEIRRRAHKRKHDAQEDSESTDPLLGSCIHICSVNNFPTAAGLASSAAGYACLVFALSKLFNVEGDISEIARQGSGSACRSIYGGFVEWEMGKENSGADSLAHQVATELHWPDLHVLILVVSAKKKHTGSTAGMQLSVDTSDLMQRRISDVVPQRMKLMKQAIEAQDFQTFAELTMKDSNQMHAVCLDTYPPISYMTDTSRDVTRLVHAVNKHYGENRVCYTYDAGPNACLYLPKDQVTMVTSLVHHFFPPASDESDFMRGISTDITELPEGLVESVPLEPQPGSIQYVIHTKVGPGPQVLNDQASLLDKQGFPNYIIS